MNFDGSDLLYFITEILEDFQNLGGVDLVGLGFRVVVLFFGVIFFILLLKFLWRVFWDVFGKGLRWVGRVVSAPYRIPRDKWQRYRQQKRYRKQAEEREKQEAEKRQQWEREAEEKERREAEIFERIMK